MSEEKRHDAEGNCTHEHEEKEEATRFLAYLKSLPDEIYRQLTVYMNRIAEGLGVPRDQCVDIAQEAWVHAFEHSEQFRGQHSFEELRSWLSAIAHNVAVDVLRKLDRGSAQSLEAAAAGPIDEEEGKRAGDAEWCECLSVWLERLRQDDPENCWLVRARYLEGLSIQQLVKETGWTEHQISNRIYRAMQKLRSWASVILSDGEVAS